MTIYDTAAVLMAIASSPTLPSLPLYPPHPAHSDFPPQFIHPRTRELLFNTLHAHTSFILATPVATLLDSPLPLVEPSFYCSLYYYSRVLIPELLTILLYYYSHALIPELLTTLLR